MKEMTAPASKSVSIEDDEETKSDDDQSLCKVLISSRRHAANKGASSSNPAEAHIFKDLSPIVESFNDDEANMILDFADQLLDDKTMAMNVMQTMKVQADDTIKKRYEGKNVADYLLKSATSFLAYVYIRRSEYT